MKGGQVSEHVATRRKLKAIPNIHSFDALLDCSTLSDKDKTILRMVYIEEKTFSCIGDFLGYSESTVKKRHSNAVSKLKKLL